MELLKIKSIAQIMKMTPDAIRFYEKNKIIEPKRGKKSGYREFSMDEIRKLYDCRSFRNVDFSVSEIEKMIHRVSKEEMYQMFFQKKKEIMDEIQKKQMELERLQEMMDVEHDFCRFQNVYMEKQMEEGRFYCYSRNEKLNYQLLDSPVYESIMKWQNLFRCTVKIPQKCIGIEGKENLEFGFSISKEQALRYGIETEILSEVLPQRSCIYTIITTPGILSGKEITPIKKWMEKKGFCIAGDAVGRVLNVVFDYGREYRNYEVWIPYGTE